MSSNFQFEVILTGLRQELYQILKFQVGVTHQVDYKKIKYKVNSTFLVQCLKLTKLTQDIFLSMLKHSHTHSTHYHID